MAFDFNKSSNPPGRFALVNRFGEVLAVSENPGELSRDDLTPAERQELSAQQPLMIYDSGDPGTQWPDVVRMAPEHEAAASAVAKSEVAEAGRAVKGALGRGRLVKRLLLGGAAVAGLAYALRRKE